MTVQTALDDMKVYVGSLDAEETLGELLHVATVGAVISEDPTVSEAEKARSARLMVGVLSLLIVHLSHCCEIKAAAPDEGMLHSCDLVQRAINAAHPADGGGAES